MQPQGAEGGKLGPEYLPAMYVCRINHSRAVVLLLNYCMFNINIRSKTVKAKEDKQHTREARLLKTR